MKTFFIVNPKAGQGKKSEELCRKIREVSPESEIVFTKKKGDAGKIAKDICKNLKGEEVRIYACGGDGTFCDTVNGVIGYENVSVGVVPVGTGNDFLKNFGNEKVFKDLKAQLSGNVKKCDAIKITDESGKNLYCANMINIGFDCNVADKAASLKKKPLISGSGAYLLAIFAMLIKKKGAFLKIIVDGEEKKNGKLLLCAVSNGKYCGGGIKSNPDANIDDGMLDVNIVHNVSRRKFLTLLPFYAKGTYKKLKKIDSIINFLKCKNMRIEPLGGKMKICVDGEIFDTGSINIEVIHKAYNFVVPK